MNNKVKESDFICPACGEVISIPRPTSRDFKMYNIKSLYCYKCEKNTNQIEVRDVHLLRKKLEFKPDLTDYELYIYNLINKEKKKVKK